MKSIDFNELEIDPRKPLEPIHPCGPDKPCRAATGIGDETAVGLFLRYIEIFAYQQECGSWLPPAKLLGIRNKHKTMTFRVEVTVTSQDEGGRPICYRICRVLTPQQQQVLYCPVPGPTPQRFDFRATDAVPA